jgi:hypothetical protein
MACMHLGVTEGLPGRATIAAAAQEVAPPAGAEGADVELLRMVPLYVNPAQRPVVSIALYRQGRPYGRQTCPACSAARAARLRSRHLAAFLEHNHAF